MSASKRDLERAHQPRTLRAGAELEPRPSRADEDDLTQAIRARELRELQESLGAALKHVERAERELAAVRSVDRATRRDLNRIRQALSRIHERHPGPKPC